MNAGLSIGRRRTRRLHLITTHAVGRHVPPRPAQYETLAVWETDPPWPRTGPHGAEYATAWQEADKVVYSSTLTPRPPREHSAGRDFDPRAVTHTESFSRSVGRWPEPRSTALGAGWSTSWPCSLTSRAWWAQPALRRTRGPIFEHRRASIQQRRRPPPLRRSVASSESPVAHCTGPREMATRGSAYCGLRSSAIAVSRAALGRDVARSNVAFGSLACVDVARGESASRSTERARIGQYVLCVGRAQQVASLDLIERV